MIVLAALIHLPFWAILSFSLTLIIGHNTLDSIKPESWGQWSWLWQMLHAGGKFASGSGIRFVAMYPLIPWPGIMSLGYCCGFLYRLGAPERRRRLLWLGGGFIVSFILLRAANIYGNLTPWAHQSRGVFTLLSFLDVTKYPPSLCYILVTLGVGLVLLSIFERGKTTWDTPLLAYGRVPFFYYIVHIVLIHGLAYGMHVFRSGRGDFSPVGGSPPPNAGVGLVWVYLVWATVVVALYPVCQWFADLKRRRRNWAWLSYL